jgi:hypothetical protein
MTHTHLTPHPPTLNESASSSGRRKKEKLHLTMTKRNEK